VISAVAETTWRQQRIRQVLLAPTTFDPFLRGLTGHVGLSQLLALKLDRYPHSLITSVATLPSMSLFSFAPLLGLEKRAKVGLMGHNKGRDNARKRAKRRKKHERLANAKQPSRDATARRGKKADK
jgi:hypothetical protein